MKLLLAVLLGIVIGFAVPVLAYQSSIQVFGNVTCTLSQDDYEVLLDIRDAVRKRR